MVKTTTSESGYKIAVDIKKLMGMTCTGRKTANEIGEKAGAVVRVGRRKLYNVQKVQEYLNEIAGA